MGSIMAKNLLWQLIVKGGIVMWPIILGSVMGLAIVIERFWVFGKAKSGSIEFENKVLEFIRQGKFDQAKELCDEKPDYLMSNIYKTGIDKRDLSPERLEKVLEQAGNNHVHKLEKHLGALATVITVEPMLGFLGTITGLINAFMSWEKAGASVTVTALAGGIYEAMITTAAGLIVAIPFSLCFNYFVSRIKYIANDLNNSSLELLGVFSEQKR